MANSHLESRRPQICCAVLCLLICSLAAATAVSLEPAIPLERTRTADVVAFPAADSKKGLQVEDLEDAVALGVKHAAFNIAVSSLLSRTERKDDILWTYRGKTYRLNASYLASQRRRIKAMTDSGALVYLIVLNMPGSMTAADSALVPPNYRADSPNGIGGFNTMTEEGRATFRAVMAFLGQYFSEGIESVGSNSAQQTGKPNGARSWPNGRVVGYIIGNEVNSHWWWYNIGEVTIEEFVDEYETAVRLSNEAISESAPWARVYVSLEHHWNVRHSPEQPLRSFPARDFLERFASVARQRGDYAWHVAFHPYPENLFDPKFWEDTQATWSEDTPKLTFKNLAVLSGFLQREELLYQGQPRRIILSEQGFHTPKGEDGEAVQAAAYCYAYRIADNLPLVDAFILHRHVDHPREGGLALGLWSYDKDKRQRARKKLSYEVFKRADTADWEGAFQFALPIVGLKNWDDAGQHPKRPVD